MNDYLLIALKTILFLVVIIMIMKIMGKRELGQLNTFDIVVFFMISELFSLSIDDPRENIMESLLPILIIFAIQLIISYIVLKNHKLRKLLEENPSFIINNGVIDQKKMKKLRYNTDDLMEQIRCNGIDNPSQILFAVLESNGQLSVIEKGKENSKIPFPLIKDGNIDDKVLKILNKDKEWLEKKLKEKGYNSEKDIFLCILDNNDNLFVVESNIK